MATKRLPIEQVLALLAAAPQRLAALTNGVEVTHLHAAPSPGEWSANEVLAHLRACADVWGDAIETILANENATIKAINPTTWIMRTDYHAQPFHASLRAYSEQRRRLVARLEALPAEAWAQSATVTGAGKPLVRTVHGFANRIAIHERPHLRQIERVVKSPLLQMS